MRFSRLLSYRLLISFIIYFGAVATSTAQIVENIPTLQDRLNAAPHDTIKATILLQAGTDLMQTDIVQAGAYFEEALQLATRHQNQTIIAKLYNQIGVNYLNQGLPKKALDYHIKALNLQRANNIELELISSYNNIGRAYYQQDKYAEALVNYLKSLELAEKLSDSSGINHSYNNIAIIYLYQGYSGKALEYFNKSLEIREQLKDQRGIAASYCNIANIYDDEEKYTEAIDYNYRALSIFEELQDTQGIARALNNLGHLFNKTGQQAKALNYFQNALNAFIKFGDLKGQAVAYSNIGENYILAAKYSEAEGYLRHGLAISESIASKDNLIELYMNFSRLYAARQDYQEAYRYHLLYTALKDSVFNETSSSQIAEMSAKFEAETKEKEIALLNTSKELQAAEIKQQVIIRNYLSVMIVMALILSVVLYRNNRIRKAANWELKQLNQAINQQKEEITAQRDNLEMLNKNLNISREEIVRQKDNILDKSISLELALEEIEKKNDSITSSLQYAQRIQSTIMSGYNKLQNKLPEHFIFFQPREIVSGDFYWFAEKNDLLFIAVVDCTGHGVPGAIMSMVGDMALNKAINEERITDPGLVLDELHKGVNKALKQEDSGSRDGMDAGLCVINRQTQTITFAGAKIPLYYIQEETLTCINGDRFSIGGRHFNGSTHYQTHTLKITSPTNLYMFTDGYQDQFGGQRGKKFMLKQLRQMLLSLHYLPLDEQKELIVEHFNHWRLGHEQVDDILVIGFKLLPV
jgi:serine phosphatase RsbU (regulator of sigma subunit)/tetratricopeptide (TPR) repeat protein